MPNKHSFSLGSSDVTIPPVKRERTYTEDSKLCPTCNVMLPLDGFYKRKNGNPQSECKTCMSKRNAERSRQRYAENPEAKREKNNEWREKNKHKFNSYTTERRIRYRNQFVEKIDIEIVAARDGHACGICGELVPFVERSLDHIRPLVLGGLHQYSNVQYAHLVCNKSKGAKLLTPKVGY